MDQRMKGGTPLMTDSALDASPVTEDFEQDQGKRKRVETDDLDAGKKEDRRGKKREGDKGAVLELLIEGRCGGAGQQQLQLCGRETSCPDGNVRLRIGVQAKRTKKPPKILESYVCKPTIRTYQRQQGRGGALPTRTATDEASGENRSGSDGVQIACKQTASDALQSLSTPPSSSAASAAAQSLTPANVTLSAVASAIANPGTKQVPLKVAGGTEVTPAASLERGKKEKSPGNHEKPFPGVLKPCSSANHQESSATLSRPCAETLPGREILKKHNGAAQAKKGLLNGRCSEDKLRDALSIKTAKHSSSVPAVDAPPPGSSKTEICSAQKNNSPSVTDKSKSSPAPHASPAQSQVREASLKRSNDKKRAKERKVKKDKRKERKPKGDGPEAERVKSDHRREEIKKKKKDKGKDGKSQQGKDHRSGDELKPEKSKTSPEKHRKEDTCSGAAGKFDHPYKVADPGRCDEGGARDHIEQAELRAATADGAAKSKDGDGVGHSTAPPKHPPSSSAPPPLSPPPSCQEQDSRPLKKRKARRPSWTKLVHRAQRVENPETDSQQSFSQKLSAHPAPSCSPTTKPSSPKQNLSISDSKEPVSKTPATPTRKRGRPKSHTVIFAESPLRLSPEEVAFLEFDDIRKSPVLDSGPKKRGRPRKRQLRETDLADKNGDPPSPPPPPPEKGNRQLKIRRLINEMKKRKKKRLHKAMTSGNGGKESVKGFARSQKTYKPIGPLTVPTLSDLSSSFGTKLGPQINVSKRGTIYMGKRRGRKPKSQTARLNSHAYAPSSLFGQPTETSLFTAGQPQPPAAHPFPSPSLTHSSGAQSPYSEGSVTEPPSALLFPPPFSLPSPSSSCTSPRPPSRSSSLSPFVKKSCPCQGRQHFPFHQSSCKLSPAGVPLRPAPSPPGHLKDATPSPRSESHSDETLPSDSGIGTDNNSVCERAEMRGVRGVLGSGRGSAGLLGGPKCSSLAEPPIARHKNPMGNAASVERQRHRHRRRDYSCPSSCNCLCPCPGHNKCAHSAYYPFVGHNALKRPKNKHKKKHQQLLMQDPEFLSELEELIGQFSEVHIGRRGWARSDPGRAFDGGRRRHSSHSHRSNIFRINLNGFYSPHPPSYAANPSFSSQSFYPCQTLHCNRKPERRQCGCPSKFQETMDNVGFYGNYPPATTLYHHLPGSYPLPSPHQYASQQPHHAHILLNPARFHRQRSRLLREGALGGEIESNGGGLNLAYASGLPCDCGGHKHKHRQRRCERHAEGGAASEHEEQEDAVAREAFSTSKSRFILGQGGGRKGARGTEGVLSKESPWSRENANHSFSTAASSSLTERSKHASLFSVGLGSSHLSSFGGGWGALGQSWAKLRGASFPNTSWGSSAGRVGPMIPSDPEDDDRDDVRRPYPSRTPPSATHTNLFTSVDAATGGGRGLRSGPAGRNLGSGDRSWRTADESAWTERREAALQGDPRSRGQLKGVPETRGAAGKNKRRPGRPRKRLLPSTLPPPALSPDLLRECIRHDGDAAGRRALSDCDGAGVSSVQRVTDSEPQAKRKRGRKRKHDASPCHQSVAEDETGCGDAPAECFGESAVELPASQPAAVQRDKSEDGPPSKTFLRAGLYSDDYKTTDPPSQSRPLSRGSADFKAGEWDYSLLPAPIHVGKYLRMKRIHFQLPYDVMWLWQHNQLQRQPSFPLKRKRRYCRLKERTFPSRRAAEESSGDLASLFPHLDMEPLSSDERSFVVTHRVFLVRNWELVRERQIRLRMEGRREGDGEAEERDWSVVCADGASGDESYIKSDVPVGVAEVTISSSDPHPGCDDTTRSLSASPRPTESRNREDDEDEEEEEEEEEAEEDKVGECSREQRRKRLNDLLLTLQHS